MKSIILITFFFYSVCSISFAQPPRGPFNTQDGGIIDGIVVKDEVPIRSAIPYEHVRLADYVWSKRVFSRIDAREKLNHELFFPFDTFDAEFKVPENETEVDGTRWVRHQERWSLWTIILRHIMLGDLTVYAVSDENFLDVKSLVEDGYQFKYPIVKENPEDYFTKQSYTSSINARTSSTGPGPPVVVEIDPGYSEMLVNDKSGKTFDEWFDSILNLSQDPSKAGILLWDKADLEKRWNKSVENDGAGFLKEDGPLRFQSSGGIAAYHIKEDWFFDKERSLLDKRIIAIAPVCKFLVDTAFSSNRGVMVVPGPDGGGEIFFNETGGNFEDFVNMPSVNLEMFWLYFPELRNVIVNYYTYNNHSDAQWMTFDDLFYKRKFNSQIYRTSDKFDREIEDYRFGIDALREAERIKGEIRKWEHDVWNY